MNPGDSPYIGPFARGGFFEEFDYNNGCVEEFIRDVCAYWLDSFQIDGIRFDFTLGFFQKGNPNVGIAKLVSDVKALLAQGGRNNVALMLEHLTDNRFEAIDDTNQICADGCWFDPFMFESSEYARNGNIDGEILRILNSNLDYAQGKAPVTYVENHDHSTIVREAGGRGPLVQDTSAGDLIADFARHRLAAQWPRIRRRQFFARRGLGSSPAAALALERR